LGSAPVDVAPTFAIVDETQIDPAVFGLVSYTAPNAPAARVDRRTAMQVPAVKRSRDLIAGPLGWLPLELFNADGVKVPWTLWDQPERNVPRTVTMTRTAEDMLFESIGWWRITEFDLEDFPGFPLHVERLKPTRVNVSDDTRKRCPEGVLGCSGTVTVDGKHEHDPNLIRFDSPNDALLVAGARAIRTCLGLIGATSRFADGVPPVDYFTPTDPNNEPENPQSVVDDWTANRRQNSTAYVPAALTYNIAGWSPDKLQLAEAKREAVLEIAREAGVDPEELGVSTTSRTYATTFDRRKAFLDFTLGGYLSAIQDRASMGDVIPQGWRSRFDLDAFLRTDPKTRYETYEVGIRVGAIDAAAGEVRQLEGKPALSTPPAVPASPALAQFDAEGPVFTVDATPSTTFAVDLERRIIRGLAVPFGKVAVSKGQKWLFSPGTLRWADVSRVKLWVGHDISTAVGTAFELDEQPEGLFAAFKVAPGPAGDHALMMAAPHDDGTPGVWDGLSIGLGNGGKYRRVGDVNVALDAPLMEISLTPAPSFDDARVHQVAAQADTEGNTMLCTHCGVVHAEGVTACDPTVRATFAAANTPPNPPAPVAAPVTFSQDGLSAITEAVRAGFTSLTTPQRQLVGAGAPLEVTEALPYRFDGIRGEHSFTADLRDAYLSNDTEARQRLETFMEEAFAVTPANVAAMNPTQNRPELYVPNLSFSRPLYELVSTGAIENQTPFTVPKFASAAGLVGTHTAGVEPTPGSFTATPQTVTPGPLSGKIEILREVWDQGGNPQTDGIIWGEMLNGWYEAIEARIAAALGTTATTELNLGSVVDVALQDALISYYAGLQFVRGGNRFTATAADAKLFPALIAAKDTTGRKLFPVLGPTNAAGQTSGAFDAVAVGQQKVAAAWALGQGTNTRSYNFVPSSVWCWTSAPKRFTFEYQLKSIDMAIWGYAATAILRDSDVKPIDYDVSDA
jgi:phage head maturation protease